uniref:TE1a n=1 Tax=Blumeria hordei TaxID=2867405 RepID=A8U3R0_BLUHO|nr:TE1a [Blumeria hordei]
MAEKGLEPSATEVDLMEVDIVAQMKERGQTDIEMFEVDKIIKTMIIEGLKDSRWANAGAESSQTASTAPEIVTEKAITLTTTKPARVAPRKIAVPIGNRTPKKSTPRGTEVPNCAEAATVSRPPPSPASISGTAESLKHAAGGASTGTTQNNPPEIEALLEAERKLAAITAAKLEVGSTVLNTLQSVILSLETTDNKEYLDAMNVCLRGALAHVLRTGTTPVPTTRNGLPNHPTPVIASVAPKKPTQPTKKSAKTAPSSWPDNRLFLRLGSKHQWRNLSPAGIREAVAQLTNSPHAAIEHVYRVPTSFALRAKDQESCQLLLNAAESFLPIEGRLKEASDLVVLRISTIPRRHPHSSWKGASDEGDGDRGDYQDYKGSSSRGSAAQKKSCLANFKKGTEPGLGFRLFDDSGVAVRHQPRQTVQQCKRCLQFHGTRGCSRAPAYWNCTSTMHSTNECHEHTKCRNCGGLHRSNSRVCLARPTKSGPVSREQLATIRVASQRELAAVARAKAAVRRAETEAQAAARQAQASPGAEKSNNRFEVVMTDVTPDATATGTSNPVESS